MDLQKDAGMTSRGPSLTPEGKEESGRGGSSRGARREGGRLPCSFAQRPGPPPICEGHRAQPSSPVATSLQRGEWHCPPERVSQFLTKPGGAELLLGALLFCGLTFFLTACCSFLSFFFFGFSFLLNFVFPGGGEEESVYKVL